MAKRAVLDWKKLQLCLERFVLACLARVILFRKNALARGDARRKVAAALSAVDIAAQSQSRVSLTIR